MNKCKWCGKVYVYDCDTDCCGHCKPKAVMVEKFAKVRDDLRERLGLKRLGDRGAG